MNQSEPDSPQDCLDEDITPELKKNSKSSMSIAKLKSYQRSLQSEFDKKAAESFMTEKRSLIRSPKALFKKLEPNEPTVTSDAGLTI